MLGILVIYFINLGHNIAPSIANPPSTKIPQNFFGVTELLKEVWGSQCHKFMVYMQITFLLFRVKQEQAVYKLAFLTPVQFTF